MLSSVLTSRERVIPWGIPQIEDRALDTAQREWGAYQGRLEETQAQLSATLSRLRQMGQRFLSLAHWLEEMERVTNIRRHRRSDRTTKETHLKKLQVRRSHLSIEVVLLFSHTTEGKEQRLQIVQSVETWFKSTVGPSIHYPASVKLLSLCT